MAITKFVIEYTNQLHTRYSFELMARSNDNNWKNHSIAYLKTI